MFYPGNWQKNQVFRLPDSLKILCDKPTAINLDGELRTSDVVNISVAQEKVRFFYPKDLSWQAQDPAHC